MYVHTGIYERLKQVAKAQGLISYGEVAPVANLDMASPADRTTISALLDWINQDEEKHGRPMISAPVVRVGEQTPGPGFFVCARNLGRLASRDEVDEVGFWAMEVKKVHTFWNNQA